MDVHAASGTRGNTTPHTQLTSVSGANNTPHTQPTSVSAASVAESLATPSDTAQGAVGATPQHFESVNSPGINAPDGSAAQHLEPSQVADGPGLSVPVAFDRPLPSSLVSGAGTAGGSRGSLLPSGLREPDVAANRGDAAHLETSTGDALWNHLKRQKPPPPRTPTR